MASSLKVNRIVPSSGTNIGFGTASGQIRLAQSAKLTFDGDTNTSIERPTSDTITITTAGSERLRINSGGYTGIGTDSIGGNLEVYNATSKINTLTLRTGAGSGGYAGLAFASNTTQSREKAAIYFQETNGGAHFTGDLVFALNNVPGDASAVATSHERLRITTTGQLIIGGNATPYPTRSATFQNASGQTNTYISIVAGNTSSVSGITFGDAVGAAGNYAGLLEYYHNGDYIAYKQNNSEKIRIQSDGRLLINTTVASGYTDRKLSIYNSGACYIEVRTPSNQQGGIIFSDGTAQAPESYQGYIAYEHTGNSMFFVTNTSERLRITSDGKVGIGIPTPGETFHVKGYVSAFQRIDVNSATHERVCGFRDGGGTERGNIKVSNASVQFNQTSDYRLKENQTPITNGITRLKTLKPYQFNFKQNPDVKVDGFFAHEVTTVPEAVSGTKDQVVVQADVDKGEYPESKLGEIIPQGIDYAKFTPLLTAALQEAIAKIETLETEVAALKAA